MSTQKYTIFWFRRDLRIDDNVGFLAALKSDFPVFPIFIFDSEILEDLPKNDARVSFIYKKIQELRTIFQEKYNSSLAIFHGKPIATFKEILSDFSIAEVYTNRDYEPYAKQRDEKIADFLTENNIELKTFKDQVIFEKNEVVKKDETPYLVYTPYMKQWKKIFKEDKLKVHYTSQYLENLIQHSRLPNLSLVDIGFEKSTIKVPDYELTPTLIEEYDEQRNIPSKNGTSNLSPHLRFGTVGIRKIVKKAIQEKDETFFEELIWREFFMQILYHYPKTVTDAFKEKYDRIEWRNNKAEFNKWKEGKTGYPLVDAGMRQLNKSGLMHNRVRMLVGSFLCKHLLIDWRWGEAYFAEKLLDYEMSSNVGNWQWVAGSGVDATPYFRIFNPTTQLDKFDKDRKYVKKWVPEFGTKDYPEPMVNHKKARERCLKVYKKAVSN